jgi:Ca-activated chloride channel family protein
LKGLAADTGGGYFELDNTTDLTPTFTKIALELHTQYVLGFTPPILDGRLHRVAVRVNRPGVTIRARRNYLASSDGN